MDTEALCRAAYVRIFAELCEAESCCTCPRHIRDWDECACSDHLVSLAEDLAFAEVDRIAGVCS